MLAMATIPRQIRRSRMLSGPPDGGQRRSVVVEDDRYWNADIKHRDAPQEAGRLCGCATARSEAADRFNRRGSPPADPPAKHAGRPKSNAWRSTSRVLLHLVTPPSQFLLTPWGAILLPYTSPVTTRKKLAGAVARGGLFVCLCPPASRHHLFSPVAEVRVKSGVVDLSAPSIRAHGYPWAGDPLLQEKPCLK